MEGCQRALCISGDSKEPERKYFCSGRENYSRIIGTESEYSDIQQVIEKVGDISEESYVR